MSDRYKGNLGEGEKKDETPDVGFGSTGDSDGTAAPVGPGEVAEEPAAASRDRVLARQIADALGAAGPSVLSQPTVFVKSFDWCFAERQEVLA